MHSILSRPQFFSFCAILVGAASLACFSLFTIKIPYTEIPVSAQSFGVFLLVLLCSRRDAIASIVLYLMLATCGLPVLAGAKADSHWMFHPSGGYLFGFVIAAFVAATILKQRKSSSSEFLWPFFSVSIGLVILLAIGSVWLGFFVGFDRAWELGAKPFLIGGIIKNVAAVVLAYAISRIQQQYRQKHVLY